MTAQDTPTVGTADELLALAAGTTGLTDFGDDDFREGLEVLISSFDADSRLTPHGVTIARATMIAPAMMTKALVGGARGEAASARYPEHTEVGIEGPVFVCGLMRTGSAALHRLLSADPAHQGIETWLAESPQPRPAREDRPSHPEFRRSQAHFAARQRVVDWGLDFFQEAGGEPDDLLPARVREAGGGRGVGDRSRGADGRSRS